MSTAGIRSRLLLLLCALLLGASSASECVDACTTTARAAFAACEGPSEERARLDCLARARKEMDRCLEACWAKHGTGR
jgi:hypothetical protein